MYSKKSLTAAALAALMASTSVASAAPAGTSDVFAPSNDNTVVNMTQNEMANTQGEFAVTIGTAIGFASLGVGAFGAGVALYGATH